LQEEQGKNAAEQARKAAEEIRTVQKELITAQEIDGQTGYAKQRAELEAHYIEEQQEYAGNAKALEIINTKHYYDEANLEAAHDAETLKNQQETNKKAEEEASRTKKEQISTLEEQIREIDRQTREADRTIKEYWDALKRDNQEKVKDWTKMGDEVGAALAKGISGGKGGMKAAFKEVLNIELDFLEKKLQSTIIALTLGDITKLGWFGLAEAAVEGAAITGIFDVAKSKISAFALGTDYAPGGPAIINERGPEMVNLPRGTQVYNHTRTSNMTANSGHTFNIHVHDAQGNILESATAAIRSGGAERFVSTLNEHLQGLN